MGVEMRGRDVVESGIRVERREPSGSLLELLLQRALFSFGGCR